MHTLILILFLIILSLPGQLLAQTDLSSLYKTNKPEKTLYARKVVTYRKLRNTGIGLGIVGGALATVGIIMISNADWHEQPSTTGTGTTYTTEDGNGAGGLFCLLGGIPALGTGIVLGSIGSYKFRQYQRKLDGLSFRMKYTPQQKGLVLAYRF